MASFQIALAKTELWEGSYSNDPNDSGGETYQGISRNNWPKWTGWPSVDLAKSQPNFPANLDTNINLQGAVVSFYRTNFWQYDNLKDQDVAWKVFDLSVNVGKVHAIKILQQAIGTTLDGVYGPNTERLTNLHPQGSLAPLIRTSAEMYHELIVKDHPQDAEYLLGWLRRDQS